MTTTPNQQTCGVCERDRCNFTDGCAEVFKFCNKNPSQCHGDSDPSCHQEPQKTMEGQDWEKQFMTRFTVQDVGVPIEEFEMKHPAYEPDKTKRVKAGPLLNFIRSVIIHAKQEERERIAKVVMGAVPHERSAIMDMQDWESGWNDARAALKQALEGEEVEVE